jgi:two-component system OmpR family response regulator
LSLIVSDLTIGHPVDRRVTKCSTFDQLVTGSADESAAAGRARPTVLLVEDERDIRLVTAAFLQSNGYNVIEAGAAGAARRELGRHEVDVVVLDLGLPDEDGLEFLRSLNGEGRGVVIVTARGEEPDRIVGLELGADDYLVKPFNPLELMARMKRLIRR